MAAIMTVERQAGLGSLGVLDWAVQVGAWIMQNLPAIMSTIGEWIKNNPGAPKPEDIVKPIIAGTYKTKKEIRDYLSSQLAALPPEIRVQYAAAIYALLGDETAQKGFRAAAYKDPALKDMTKNDAFGDFTFWEQFGTPIMVGAGVLGGLGILYLVSKAMKK
jgi:hypothetical protein